MDSLIGTTLHGRYRVLERIGAGAMGAVYRAEQVGLGRAVALKVLKKQHEAGSDVVARFEREARAMSALTHPNTVRVYDFGATVEGRLFLAMELLEGELASNRLNRTGPVSAREAITWVRQLLRSLGEAHAKGIIHRDIKPDNIFLAHDEGAKEPVAKVLDFGIAKSIEGDRAMNQFETMDGTVFGTPRYMSPEQAQGKTLDARSDLYAVGIVLYELLVGAPPFVDKDAVIVMAKHIREEPPTLRRSAPGRTLPASLQSVLDRALAKSPTERFQTAEQFERALDRCLRYADLLERLPARGQQLMNAALRAPRMARFGTAVALFALLAVVGTRLAVGHGAVGSMAAPSAQRPSAAAAQKTQARAPTPPETNLVTLYSEPAGANVWHHGRFVGVTPLPVEVEHERSLRVRVAMAGFEAQTLDLNPKEGVRSVKLERLHPPVVRAPAPVAAPAAEPAQLTQRERARPQHKPKRAAANATEKAQGEPAQQQAREAYEKF